MIKTALSVDYDDEPLARLTPPQSRHYQSTCKYPLFVGGFGSGKTTTLSVNAITDLINYPGADIACYAPTYDLLKLVTQPYIEERLNRAGLGFSFHKTDHIYTVPGYGRVICRSLNNPGRIIAYEVFRSHVDEIDTLPLALAEHAWNKVIARNRQKIYVRDDYGNRILKPGFVPTGKKEDDPYQTELNRVSAYTTPEGYQFAYNRWVKLGGDDYVVYRASTYSNPHLPDGYIQGLIDTYPANLIEAYLNGEFVNLTSGAVYPHFDRTLNGCDSVVVGNEPLAVGMDFNVLKGAAAIHVMRGDDPHCVDQIVKAYDTDAQIAYLKATYPHNPITIYPDASGGRRTSANTTASDIAKLRAAGYRIKAPNANPAVKDRVAALNAMICNGSGVRRYKVNVAKCPDITDGLEQQVYDKNGQPDKANDLDHGNDAVGYFINYEYGLVKPVATLTVIEGHY